MRAAMGEARAPIDEARLLVAVGEGRGAMEPAGLDQDRSAVGS